MCRIQAFITWVFLAPSLILFIVIYKIYVIKLYFNSKNLCALLLSTFCFQRNSQKIGREQLNCSWFFYYWHWIAYFPFCSLLRILNFIQYKDGNKLSHLLTFNHSLSCGYDFIIPYVVFTSVSKILFKISLPNTLVRKVFWKLIMSIIININTFNSDQCERRIFVFSLQSKSTKRRNIIP